MVIHSFKSNYTHHYKGSVIVFRFLITRYIMSSNLYKFGLLKYHTICNEVA